MSLNRSLNYLNFIIPLSAVSDNYYMRYIYSLNRPVGAEARPQDTVWQGNLHPRMV